MGNDKDGISKNISVVKKQFDSYADECKIIQAEVNEAWDTGDMKEFVHKSFAPVPECFQMLYRFWGYLALPTMLVILPAQVIYQLIRKQLANG